MTKFRREKEMKFALLASGSKGNCALIQHGDTNIIIDCGTTKKYLNQCFETLAYDYHKADALLITHTHKDHVSQIKMFRDLEVYATQAIDTPHLHHLEPFTTFTIKDLTIHVLPMSHDCEGTVGFVLETANEKMVYVTDTGYIRDDVKPYLKDADYYIFESNHDIEMLMQTRRPVYIKQRIINDYGHLCNSYCAELLSDIISPTKTKEIVLAHISQEGNTYELALQTLKDIFTTKHIDYSKMTLYAAKQFEIYQSQSGGES